MNAKDINPGGEHRPRVLMVGLDGGTFKVIKPLVRQGRLPHLAGMMDDGVWGELRSTLPSITPTAWTSFATGKNPGKHGLFDFQVIDPKTYAYTSRQANEHGQKTLWALLTEQGRRSIVLDVPFTYPPEPIDGLMVSGFGTPRTADVTFTHPASLGRELRERYGEFSLALPRHSFDRSEAFFSEWRRILAQRERIASDLIVERDWDLFMIVFSVTDSVAHSVWTYYDPRHPNYYSDNGPLFRRAFEGFYEQCDGILGCLMERAPDADVIVMSDHGFGTKRPREYFFDALARGGFIRYKGRGAKRRVAKLLTNLYVRFPSLREVVKNLRPDRRKRLKSALRQQQLLPSVANIDYARSQVIPANFGLELYVNHSGRFVQGPVGPGEVGAVCDQVSEHLLALRDEVTGDPVVRQIYRPREIYHGPRVDQAADLVIEYTDMYSADADGTTLNPRWEGRHQREGILLAQGPHLGQGRVEDAGIEDLAPTVLHLLGLRVPEDMDGRVLQELLAPLFAASRPVQPGPPATGERTETGQFGAKEQAELETQLRALGYL